MDGVDALDLVQLVDVGGQVYSGGNRAGLRHFQAPSAQIVNVVRSTAPTGAPCGTTKHAT